MKKAKQGSHSIIWLSLTGHDFRIIEEMKFLQKDKLYCFPSQKYLSEKLGVSVRTIRRSVQRLKSLGVINVRARAYRRKDGTVQSQSNLYQVNGSSSEVIDRLKTSISWRATKWAKAKIATPSQQFENLTRIVSEGDIIVLRNLTHSQMVLTDYWKIIANYLKEQKKFCERCGTNKDLHVHHLSYDHKGEEFRYLEDLQVICATCHEIRHRDEFV